MARDGSQKEPTPVVMVMLMLPNDAEPQLAAPAPGSVSELHLLRDTSG